MMGIGGLHLDIKVDILKRTHGVEVVGAPLVAANLLLSAQKILTRTRSSLVVQVNLQRSIMWLAR